VRGGVEPEPIVAVRAAQFPDVRGQRVVVGRAGLGWRRDLRADSLVVQDGKTFVPVLTEHDWYRAEAEDVEVFAPLVPVSRVWVEAPAAEVLVDIAAPEPRWPVPIDQKISVTGSRVVYLAPAPAPVFERGWRAVSDVRQSAGGRSTLLVVHELEWYRWAWTGRMPKAMEIPADNTWAE
jgi:hypothetical protein